MLVAALLTKDLQLPNASANQVELADKWGWMDLTGFYSALLGYALNPRKHVLSVKVQVVLQKHVLSVKVQVVLQKIFFNS